MIINVEEDGPLLAETESIGRVCVECDFIVWVEFDDSDSVDTIWELPEYRMDIIQGVVHRSFDRRHDCSA